MKILFCIKALNNPGGGAERVFVDVVNALAERGHDIKVVTFEKPGGRAFYPLSEDIERIDLNIGNAADKARFVETISRILSLRRFVLKEAPDVVVGFMHSMFVPLSFALLGTKFPLVASEHIVPFHYVDRPLQRFLLYVSTIFVSRYTVVSEQVKDEYPLSIRRKMQVVLNPVKWPPNAPSAQDTGNDSRLFLSVGRLSEQKDHKTLIQAFARVSAHNPDWRLRIVGDGELRSHLKRLTTKLNIEQRVELLQSTRNIDQHYSASAVLVQPSRYESFGLTAAEALLAGIPVIAFSDCQGLNKLVEHQKNGLLVEIGEDRVKKLAQALELFIHDETLRSRLQREPSKLSRKYTLASVVDAWETLLDELCMERPINRMPAALPSNNP